MRVCVCVREREREGGRERERESERECTGGSWPEIWGRLSTLSKNEDIIASALSILQKFRVWGVGFGVWVFVSR